MGVARRRQECGSERDGYPAISHIRLTEPYLPSPSSIGVWLYDANTGAEVNLLAGHTSVVRSVAFSPDGTKVAGGSFDRTIRLWDVRSGKVIHTLAGHADSVDAIVFSPDGATLASKSRDKIIRLWDVHTGEPLQTLTGLHLGSRNNQVRLWDAELGETALTLTVELHQHWLSSIVFSSDRALLASGRVGDTIHSSGVRVIDVVPSLKDRLWRIRSVAFSPDDAVLAIALGDWWGDNSIIRLWDTHTGEVLHTLEGHWNARDMYVAFSPDGDTFASAGGSVSMVRLWDARTGELLGRPETFSSGLRSIAFSPDGSTLAWTRGNAIYSWNVRTGVLQRPSIGWHYEIVNSLAFSPDGLTLASVSLDGTIRLWDPRTGEQKHTLFGHRSDVTCVAFSPDGSTVVSGSRDSTIRFWDARSGNHKRSIAGQIGDISCLAFSHDGRTLASGSGDPEGKYNDYTVWIWDAHTVERLWTLEGHTSGISAVAFIPDGYLLASGSYDDTIRIWDTRTGEHLQTLTGHTYNVTSIAVSPDGNFLVSGSRDGTILLWEFKHATTWGSVKRTAAESTLPLPELSPSTAALAPTQTALLPNYPNPFNPETWIPYQLKTSAEVTLTIFDSKGQAVRALAVGHQPTGTYRSRDRAVYWDGRNRQGELVANGVYFYTLSAGDFSATRKMLVGK